MTAHRRPRSNASFVIGPIVGAVVVFGLLALAALIRPGSEAQTAEEPLRVPAVTAQTQTPSRACERTVTRALTRYGMDSRSNSFPAWILPREREAMTDVEFAAYSAAMGEYSVLVMEDMALAEAISRVIPAVRRVCARA